MNFKQSVPEYLSSRKNTIIQIFFTALFAFIFIITYRPFGYDKWYGNIGKLELLAGTAVVVLLGMVVVVVSRIGMFIMSKTHEITLAVYIWMIAVEILLMGGFYTSLEIFILHDKRSTLSLLFNAVQNTSLILLIPYTLSILFFAWKDIKLKLDKVIQQFRDPGEIFIPIKDEKGVLRLTLKSINILFLESNDNYVNVYYLDNNKTKTYLVRNSLKQMEKSLKFYPIYRCHRSYSVNLKNVKMVRKAKKGYELVINSPKEECLPISLSYEKKILDLLNFK